ncbi:Extracellular superoxide dismutase [Cu-Zn] [Strongyloides ratti]|uniref:Extracellular superoxide dismutase [Cu-Zn] n=1 Tax=Strongyloides ratti TaxID=34506 RepID=A0A090L430_STRRB|nr:Extracellular superoxide dismutase [Cu-Zn] [Strongyloides ratti]CEF64571.1 Extracellular superoxide dismutase [Cu-Zn] [Strongyloides ratti]
MMKIYFPFSSFLLLSSIIGNLYLLDAFENGRQRELLKAVAKVTSPDGSIYGFGTFSQEYSADAQTHIKVKINGLPSGKSFGIQIREWGNLTRGCDSMGNEFNPDNIQTHIGIRFPAHKVGTLGNIIDGKFDQWNDKVTLFDRNNVFGRGLVIFENPDDGGMISSPNSSKDGNVGRPIACGIIGRYAAKFLNDF